MIDRMWSIIKRIFLRVMLFVLSWGVVKACMNKSFVKEDIFFFILIVIMIIVSSTFKEKVEQLRKDDEEGEK